MRIVYFTHSLASCWNHGNAHFLRGVLRELLRLGHEVRVFEPQGAWSLANLLADHGVAGLTRASSIIISPLGAEELCAMGLHNIVKEGDHGLHHVDLERSGR